MTEPRNNLLFVCTTCNARAPGRHLVDKDGKSWGVFIQEGEQPVSCRFFTTHTWTQRSVSEELALLRQELAAIMMRLGVGDE